MRALRMLLMLFATFRIPVQTASPHRLGKVWRFFPGASKHDARQVQRSRKFTDIRSFLKVGTHALHGMASPDLQLAKNAAPPFCCCIPI